MKKLITIFLVVALTLPLMGCGKSYQVLTKTGESYIADKKPEYDKSDDVYTFTDLDGKEVILNKGDVKAIIEYEKDNE